MNVRCASHTLSCNSYNINIADRKLMLRQVVSCPRPFRELTKEPIFEPGLLIHNSECYYKLFIKYCYCMTNAGYYYISGMMGEIHPFHLEMNWVCLWVYLEMLIFFWELSKAGNYLGLEIPSTISSFLPISYTFHLLLGRRKGRGTMTTERIIKRAFFKFPTLYKLLSMLGHTIAEGNSENCSFVLHLLNVSRISQKL